MTRWMRDDRLLAEAAAHPYPLIFATVSGAHLYGFPSPDSDFDLRGSHVLPAREVVGLGASPETVALSHVRDGAEVDLVTHDVRKFFSLLLRLRLGGTDENTHSQLEDTTMRKRHDTEPHETAPSFRAHQ